MHLTFVFNPIAHGLSFGIAPVIQFMPSSGFVELELVKRQVYEHQSVQIEMSSEDYVHGRICRYFSQRND
jgi:hypothetical protein